MKPKYLDILLDENYRLRSDDHCFFIARNMNRRDKRTGEPVWQAITWHVSLEHALKSYRTRCIRECGARTFEALLGEIRAIDRRILRMTAVTGEPVIAEAADSIRRVEGRDRPPRAQEATQTTPAGSRQGEGGQSP